ncbi:hypothetical protein TNCV_3043571 [Trichonephila clavipes]|nr:hypothetical protein TNCV_3043571 [Trichonephila clavipes]
MSNISKYPGHLPGFRLLRQQSSQPGPRWSRRCLRKQVSSYGPREISLYRTDQTSVSANFPDHSAQSITLDMLYPMHFAHQRLNVQALRHVGTTYEPLCSLEHFAVVLYILTYN